MNINHYTKIFIKNIMLGAGNLHLSLTDHDHVLLAVESAYKAMQPRTFVKTNVNAQIDVNARAQVFSDLAEMFVDYFKAPAPATQADFDKWHKDTCDWFLNTFNNNVLAKSGYENIKYGKAQKIINVVFKYLYLFSPMTEGYPMHFTFCHFVVDNDTLKWYRDKVRKKLGAKSPTASWSNIDYHEYIEIQKNIRTYLFSQSKYPKEPFLAEFEIWSEYAF